MPTVADSAKRATLIRDAFRLEWLSIAWMVIEGAVAIGSGIAAHSLLLVAFGIESVIELASACVLVWRLSVELRHGQAFSEAAERRASRLAGGLLFALALYVVVAAGSGLWQHHASDFSMPGIVLALTAMPIMYFLSIESWPWPNSSQVGRSGPTPSKASHAAGYHSSWSWVSPPNSPSAPGGSTRCSRLSSSTS
ncbi:MAG: DUF2975 domain-containing protein [Bryobacterales bacterium]|nr:DUF2975 domain-containing protein [Bryobacterales bacterium]